MKERILTGWTVRRVLYVGIGIWVIIYAVMAREWWGIFLGAYFAGMGLFSFGCAAGSCSVHYKQKEAAGKSGVVDHVVMESKAVE
jgi:hypothetical protein